MLVMDVPTDINQVDPKSWFGFTLRQLGCVGGIAVCAISAIACQFLAPASVSSVINQVIIIPIAILVAVGWFRKSGLPLEDWLARYVSWRRDLKPRPLIYGGAIPAARPAASAKELKRVDEHAMPLDQEPAFSQAMQGNADGFVMGLPAAVEEE